jgi:hypothetical protein
MRGPGANDERFMGEVARGRFSVDAQGRIWRHILFNQAVEAQLGGRHIPLRREGKSGSVRVYLNEVRDLTDVAYSMVAGMTGLVVADDEPEGGYLCQRPRFHHSAQTSSKGRYRKARRCEHLTQ